jgi:glutamate racemase
MVQVWEQSCPLFVPLVEEGIVDDPITDLVARRYLTSIIENKIKTIILGCTHYPVLKNDLIKVLGKDVNLVESGAVLSKQLRQLFKAKVIAESSGNDRQIRVCITDLTDHFERLAHLLMGPEKIGHLEKVVL